MLIEEVARPWPRICSSLSLPMTHTTEIIGISTVEEFWSMVEGAEPIGDAGRLPGTTSEHECPCGRSSTGTKPELVSKSDPFAGIAFYQVALF
jgi:hypothetical protein